MKNHYLANQDTESFQNYISIVFLFICRFYDSITIDPVRSEFWRKELKISASLLVIMIVEFIVSLAVFIFSCRGSCGGCCSGDCRSFNCCDLSSKGMMFDFVKRQIAVLKGWSFIPDID